MQLGNLSIPHLTCLLLWLKVLPHANSNYIDVQTKASPADLPCLQDLARLYLFALVLQCLILIPYLIRVAQHEHKQSTRDIVGRLLDAALLYAFPPGSPTVMLVVGGVARSRLMNIGLLLKSPEILKQVADVDVICFDKTGTLTHSAVSSCVGDHCAKPFLST